MKHYIMAVFKFSESIYKTFSIVPTNVKGNNKSVKLVDSLGSRLIHKQSIKIDALV